MANFLSGAAMQDSPGAISASHALWHAWTSAMWPVGIIPADPCCPTSSEAGVQQAAHGGAAIAPHQDHKRAGWRLSLPARRARFSLRRNEKAPA